MNSSVSATHEASVLAVSRHDSHGVETIPKPFFRLLDGAYRERIPDHAGGRSHVSTDGEIRPRPGTDKFHERLLPRADMGNEDAHHGRGRIPFDGLDQIRVLGKRAPYLPSAACDGPLHHLRAGKHISTEPGDKRRSDPVPTPVMQDVEVCYSDIAVEEPLDDLLVLVVSPDGVNGNMERFDPFEEKLKRAKQTVLSRRSDHVLSGKRQDSVPFGSRQIGMRDVKTKLPVREALETPFVEKPEVPGVDHGIGPDPVGQFVDHPEPSVCVADQQESHAAIP